MLEALLGAILISFAPVMVKLLPFQAAEIAAFRTFTGGLFLFLFLCFFYRRELFFSLRRLSPLVMMFFSGTAFALDMYVWNLSVLSIGAGLATVLANTQVFYMTAWGVVSKEERLDSVKLISLVLGFLGLVLIARAQQQLTLQEDYLFGVGMGALAGLAYTGYMLFFRRAIQKLGRGVTPSLSMISLICGIWMIGLAVKNEGLTWGMLADIDGATWGKILFLGVGVHVGGWFFISRALQKLPPSLVGLSLLAQPLLASLWGYAFFGERFTKEQIGGIILTLLGIGAIHVDRYRTRRRGHGPRRKRAAP